MFLQREMYVFHFLFSQSLALLRHQGLQNRMYALREKTGFLSVLYTPVAQVIRSVPGSYQVLNLLKYLLSDYKIQLQ